MPFSSCVSLPSSLLLLKWGGLSSPSFSSSLVELTGLLQSISPSSSPNRVLLVTVIVLKVYVQQGQMTNHTPGGESQREDWSTRRAGGWGDNFGSETSRRRTMIKLRHNTPKTPLWEAAERRPWEEGPQGNEVAPCWCLYFRHHSNKACEVLHDAGLFLPSQRTLTCSQCRCRKL